MNYKSPAVRKRIFVALLVSLLVLSLAIIGSGQADRVSKKSFQMVVNNLLTFGGYNFFNMVTGTDNSGFNIVSTSKAPISVFAPVILKFLIPFWSLLIILAGIYYTWGSYSHVSR